MILPVTSASIKKSLAEADSDSDSDWRRSTGLALCSASDLRPGPRALVPDRQLEIRHPPLAAKKYKNPSWFHNVTSRLGHSQYVEYRPIATTAGESRSAPAARARLPPARGRPPLACRIQLEARPSQASPCQARAASAAAQAGHMIIRFGEIHFFRVSPGHCSELAGCVSFPILTQTLATRSRGRAAGTFPHARAAAPVSPFRAPQARLADGSPLCSSFEAHSLAITL